MSTQTIGLDIGTNAVRAVELSFGRDRPVLRRMGQVGLPPGAVVAGEVVDPAAVSSALKRLWREAGFRSRSVVVGVANARAVVRVTELPRLPEAELRSSLPFQVQDLIPMPVGEAQLDFCELEDIDAAGDQERVRVLLVAAHLQMLRMLLAAVEGAGLRAAAIDLVPFALVRALYDPAASVSADTETDGPEAIIGVGAGVTNVIVHEHGIPRFVRTMPTGGLAITGAIAGELGLENEAAESLKRGDESSIELVAQASVTPLARDVSGSVDYHLAQAGSRLRRVVLSGGGARLHALRSALSEQLGAEVVVADPFERLEVGKVGLDPDVLQSSADLFTVAIGLSLAGRSIGGKAIQISLLPAEIEARRGQRRQAVLAGAGVAGVALALAGVAYLEGQKVSDARTEAAGAEAQSARLTSELAGLQDVLDLETKIDAQREVVRGTLAGEVAWPLLLWKIDATRPSNVWLESFSGGSATPGTAPTIQITAGGTDHDSVARWLQQVATLPEVSNVWVSSSAKEAGSDPVTFTSTADVTPAAGSDRAARLDEVAK